MRVLGKLSCRGYIFSDELLEFLHAHRLQFHAEFCQFFADNGNIESFLNFVVKITIIGRGVLTGIANPLQKRY
jgi:hypothetical protein